MRRVTNIDVTRERDAASVRASIMITCGAAQSRRAHAPRCQQRAASAARGIR